MQLPDSRGLWRSARNCRKWVKLDLLIKTGNPPHSVSGLSH
jgi:hypothetical protein